MALLLWKNYSLVGVAVLVSSSLQRLVGQQIATQPVVPGGQIGQAAGEEHPLLIRIGYSINV